MGRLQAKIVHGRDAGSKQAAVRGRVDGLDGPDGLVWMDSAGGLRA